MHSSEGGTAEASSAASQSKHDPVAAPTLFTLQVSLFVLVVCIGAALCLQRTSESWPCGDRDGTSEPVFQVFQKYLLSQGTVRGRQVTNFDSFLKKGKGTAL